MKYYIMLISRTGSKSPIISLIQIKCQMEVLYFVLILFD